MQLKMFLEHPEKKPIPFENPNIVMGDKYQHELARKLTNVIDEEMRGSLTCAGVTINFTHDIVCEDKIVEIKYVDPARPAEDWYLKSSLLQCAVYKALSNKSGGHLETASFRVNLGYPKQYTRVPNDIPYILYFGDDKYRILTTNDDAIVKFIIDKACASLDWTLAKQFDAMYKHMEFQALHPHFNVVKI
jgi:hypothetical protein